MHDLVRRLDINAEFASPLDFIPALDGWEDRSPFVAQHGAITVRHLDFRLQALAKLARYLDQDADDVVQMLRHGWIHEDTLTSALEEIGPRLFRFPQLDAGVLAGRLADTISRYRAGRED